MKETLLTLVYMLGEMSPYILLGFLIAGLLHSFVPQQMMTRHLAGSGVKPVVKSALMGVPLPLCSCGVLPTAIGLRRNGASRASATSFLISTPQTGIDSIAATWSLLGPAFAVIRPIAAFVTGIFGGVAVGRTEATDDRSECADDCIAPGHTHGSFFHKLGDALRYGFIDLVGSIGSWLVIGLIIAALITVYVPDNFFSILGRQPIFSMIAVIVIAIPMYVCATGSIPIAMSLMLKGLSPGTALVLLMAGPAANFASFTLISREMGRKAAGIYLASIIIGSISFGLIVDYLLPSSWFILPMTHAGSCCHTETFEIFPTICSAILVALLAYSFIKEHHHHHHTLLQTDMTQTYTIKGMNCPHCQASAQKAIAGVTGVTDVHVDLHSGIATVQGEASAADIAAAVRAAGFDIA